MAPLDIVNAKTNLPAQIDLCATSGAQYDFQFIAKGMLLHRYFFVSTVYVCTIRTLLCLFMYLHVYVNVCKVVHKDMKCMEHIMLMH